MAAHSCRGRTADWKGEVGYVTPMVENRINCGLGKRGRCSIGPVYARKDGPVFTAALMKALPAEF